MSIDTTEQRVQKPTPTGLDIIHGILNGLKNLEDRVTQLEQNLTQLTISGEAVNAISASTIRTLAQVLHAAVTPQQVTEPVQEEEKEVEEEIAIEQVA